MGDTSNGDCLDDASDWSKMAISQCVNGFKIHHIRKNGSFKF